MDKPKLRQRITLNISITIGCFIFIFALCAILSGVSYNISSNTLYTRYKAQMKSIVDVAESYIDHDDMSECAETYVESAKYQETQAYFDQFVTHYADLHYLYVLKVTPEDDPVPIRAVCSASTEQEKAEDPDSCLHLGDGEVGWYSEAVIKKFREITDGTEDVFFFEDSDWGRDYTLARPLIDSNGKHYAVLCVDIAVSTINNAINRIVWITVATILGIGILFSILLMIYMYFAVVKPLRKLQKSVSDFANESHDKKNPSELFYTAPKLNGGKEIYTLATSVEKMSSDMRKYVLDIIDREKQVKHLEASVEEMNMIATHDALTGVFNKAAYDKVVDALNNEMKINKDLAFALAMIDINNLKGINDTYGHDHGDEYIIGAVKMMRKIFKNSAIYRIGGDEIIILLRDKDYENKEHLVDVIKKEFLKSTQNEKAVEYRRFSAAVGLAIYYRECDANVDSVFQRADKAMYQNKAEMKESN